MDKINFDEMSDREILEYSNHSKENVERYLEMIKNKDQIIIDMMIWLRNILKSSQED